MDMGKNQQDWPKRSTHMNHIPSSAMRFLRQVHDQKAMPQIHVVMSRVGLPRSREILGVELMCSSHSKGQCHSSKVAMRPYQVANLYREDKYPRAPQRVFRHIQSQLLDCLQRVRETRHRYRLQFAIANRAASNRRCHLRRQRLQSNQVAEVLRKSTLEYQMFLAAHHPFHRRRSVHCHLRVRWTQSMSFHLPEHIQRENPRRAIAAHATLDHR